MYTNLRKNLNKEAKILNIKKDDESDPSGSDEGQKRKREHSPIKQKQLQANPNSPKPNTSTPKMRRQSSPAVTPSGKSNISKIKRQINNTVTTPTKTKDDSNQTTTQHNEDEAAPNTNQQIPKLRRQTSDITSTPSKLRRNSSTSPRKIPTSTFFSPKFRHKISDVSTNNLNTTPSNDLQLELANQLNHKSDTTKSFPSPTKEQFQTETLTQHKLKFRDNQQNVSMKLAKSQIPVSNDQDAPRNDDVIFLNNDNHIEIQTNPEIVSIPINSNNTPSDNIYMVETINSKDVVPKNCSVSDVYECMKTIEINQIVTKIPQPLSRKKSLKEEIEDAEQNSIRQSSSPSKDPDNLSQKNSSNNGDIKNNKINGIGNNLQTTDEVNHSDNTNPKISIPLKVARKVSYRASQVSLNMQRKYNMALQHFYQAATHSSTDENNSLMKAKLQDLSGSEEELFSTEKGKAESYEMTERNGDGKFSDFNENSYFSFKKKNKLSVKRVKPVALCTLRGCGIFWLWCFLFFIGVFLLTYFLKIAIGKIHANTNQSPVVYERYHENFTDKNGHMKSVPQSCSNFKVKKVWHKSFDKFQTESATRLVDVNNDGIDDIITGFVTSLDSAEADIEKRREICKENFHHQFPCFGGLFAVDGESGDKIWTHYTMHDIYAVNCNADLDQDGVPDCLAAGRGGAFEAVSGKTGNLLWMFLDKIHKSEQMNLYTPQFINDVDYDGIMDILQVHGGDPFAEPHSEKRLAGKILFFSGKSGMVLKSIPVPNSAETYFSPVIYTSKNGSQIVVIGTGGETHPGALYAIQLSKLWEEKIDEALLLQSGTKTGKGFMNPPALVDINKDGVVDLVSSNFADEVHAFDGETLKTIWKYEIKGTESYSIPGVGYYNDDDVVDFMIRMNTGPGFPVYYDSKVLILNGKNGMPLSNKHLTSAPAHSSPLTVSMEGTGNDLFLFWSVDCTDHEHRGGWYDYVKGTNVHESSRADSCMARYNTPSFSKFYVANSKTGLPGKEIYFSDDYSKLERRNKRRISSRHIGVPDHGGVQRIIQTGTVATSLKKEKGENDLGHTFDVIFAMYYITPPQVRSIRPKDKKCIEDYLKKVKAGLVHNKVDLESNKKQGIFDHGDTATNVCLKKRLNSTNLDNQESAEKKNFNKGKLTLYRFQVTCQCDPGVKCARVLPKSEQGWTSYMGSLANGYFNNRQKERLQV